MERNSEPKLEELSLRGGHVKCRATSTASSGDGVCGEPPSRSWRGVAAVSVGGSAAAASADCASLEEAAEAFADGARPRYGDASRRLRAEQARDWAGGAAAGRGTSEARGAGEGEEERGGNEVSGR